MQFQVPRGETWYIIWARATQMINAACEWEIKVNEIVKRHWRNPDDIQEVSIKLLLAGGSYVTVQNLSYAGTALADKMSLLVNRKVGS